MPKIINRSLLLQRKRYQSEMDGRWCWSVIYLQYARALTCYLHLLQTDQYSRLCTIKADISHLPKTPKINPSGGTYYRIDYSVILLFGLTELKAQLCWNENVRYSLWIFLCLPLLKFFSLGSRASVRNSPHQRESILTSYWSTIGARLKWSMMISDDRILSFQMYS